MSAKTAPRPPLEAGAPAEVDFSDPSPDDFEALARDRVPVRSLAETDLAGVTAIDRRLIGRERSDYLRRKFDEALKESGIRVSLAAELDGHIVGFVMARVDFGEFGLTEPEAVIDTIGVDPDYARRGVASALLSQLLANLRSLRVDSVRTEVDWDLLELIAFLGRRGFRPSQRLAFSRTLV